MKTILTTLAAGTVSLMLASAANAQMMMKDYDTDADGMLSMEEYGVENNEVPLLRRLRRERRRHD